MLKQTFTIHSILPVISTFCAVQYSPVIFKGHNFGTFVDNIATSHKKFSPKNFISPHIIIHRIQ